MGGILPEHVMDSVRKAAEGEPGSSSVSGVPLWFLLQAPGDGGL